jgi:hypothetical protein
MKIGNRNVATFQTTTTINILEPGGIYPAQQSTYWVINDTGSGPISLTLDELRALECGAPVSIVMTQMNAEVMLMNEGGQWESAGDWGQYMARCEAVCSNMYLEIGAGNFLHYLVYSDDELSAPRVTFGDALAWAAGAGTTQTELWITYTDDSGQKKTASLEDWNFCFDAQTLINNGFTGSPLEPPTPDYNLKNLVLFPFTQIIGSIPREQIPDVEGPEIIYAYLDEQLDVVKALAVDYSGIEELVFIDKNGTEYPMNEVIAGSGFYEFSLFGGYISHQTDGNGMQERIRAQSVDLSVAPVVHDVETVFYPEETITIPPTIGQVKLDMQNRLLTAEVVADSQFPIISVKVYHPAIPYGGENMIPHEEWWNYPDKYIYSLPEAITDYNFTELTIVATTVGGGYDIHEVTTSDMSRTWYSGSASIETDWRWTYNQTFLLIREEWWSSRMDIDKDDAEQVQLYRDTGYWSILAWQSVKWYADDWDSYHFGDTEFWFRWYDNDDDGGEYYGAEAWMMLFSQDWLKYTGPKTFETITEADIASAALNDVPSAPIPHSLIGSEPLCNKYGSVIHVGDLPAIFLMKTSEGRFAKIKVINICEQDVYTVPNYEHIRLNVDLEYVTFYKETGISTLNSGTIPTFQAVRDEQAPADSFTSANFDFDSESVTAGPSHSPSPWDPAWDPAPPVDIWLRFYTGDNDPYNYGSDPGWVIGGSYPFKIINEDLDLNDLELADFESGLTDYSNFMMLHPGSFSTPVTLLMQTDLGNYGAIKFNQGWTTEPDVYYGTLDCTYVTFEEVELD